MRSFLIFLLSLIWLPATAQVILEPLEYNYLQDETKGGKIRLKTAATNDTLNLPFWDDFTVKKTTDSLWIPGGGTYINNTYCLNPYSYNVATFDGLKSNGRPYVPGIITATGPADSLTSKPLDLSQYVSGDKLHLRFFWQAGGNGDAPDEIGDSIRLQLKTKNGNWNTVWWKNNFPELDNTKFYFDSITFSDPNYFYKGFQFRFQSFGKLSGNVDVWNIDYVMLDEGELASQRYAPDLTYVSVSPSILKNYTSMPLVQFEKNFTGNKSNELIDSLEFTGIMLKNELIGNFRISLNSDTSFIKNSTTGTLYQTFTQNTSNNFKAPFQTRVQKLAIDSASIPLDHLPKQIRYQSSIVYEDAKVGTNYVLNPGESELVSRLNFNVNNSISNTTTISNYYAYDDGSAELGFGITAAYGKVAVKYRLNVSDTLTAVRINFPSINKEFDKSPFTIAVWTGVTPGQPSDNLVTSQTFVLEHPTFNNGFFEYELDDPWILDANTDIYIGYIQPSTNKLLVGFDKNTDYKDKIYLKTGNVWDTFKLENGSLMIRPVFGSKFTLGTTPAQQTLEANIYPNPTSGSLTINGKVKNASLYDISGRLLLSTSFDDYNIYTDHQLNVSHLNNGLYLLHLETDGAKVVKKVIISK